VLKLCLKRIKSDRGLGPTHKPPTFERTVYVQRLGLGVTNLLLSAFRAIVVLVAFFVTFFMAEKHKSRMMDKLTRIHSNTEESTSCVEIYEHTHKWNINNFSYLMWKKNGERIFSSTFKVADRMWMLALYPNGFKFSQGCLSIYLLLLSSSEPVYAKVSFTLESPLLDESIYKSAEPHLFNSQENKSGFQKMAPVSSFKEVDANISLDRLTVICAMTILDGKAEYPPPNWHFHGNLSQDLSDLLASEELADFTIHCGGKSFPCHKAILLARCPYFGGMLRHNMKEAIDGEVTLDEDPELMSILLEFIYTGTVKEAFTKGSYKDIYELARKMLLVADKYSLDNLRAQSEYVMKKNSSRKIWVKK
jgi:hypothetical protein